jgi:hypothetical protein
MKNLIIILIVLIVTAGCSRSPIEGHWLNEEVNSTIFIFEDSTYRGYYQGAGPLLPANFHIEGDSLKLEREPNGKIIWIDNDNFKLEIEEITFNFKRIKKWKADIYMKEWHLTYGEF